MLTWSDYESGLGSRSACQDNFERYETASESSEWVQRYLEWYQIDPNPRGTIRTGGIANAQQVFDTEPSAAAVGERYPVACPMVRHVTQQPELDLLALPL